MHKLLANLLVAACLIEPSSAAEDPKLQLKNSDFAQHFGALKLKQMLSYNVIGTFVDQDESGEMLIIDFCKAPCGFNAKNLPEPVIQTARAIIRKDNKQVFLACFETRNRTLNARIVEWMSTSFQLTVAEKLYKPEMTNDMISRGARFLRRSCTGDPNWTEIIDDMIGKWEG